MIASVAFMGHGDRGYWKRTVTGMRGRIEDAEARAILSYLWSPVKGQFSWEDAMGMDDSDFIALVRWANMKYHKMAWNRS